MIGKIIILLVIIALVGFGIWMWTKPEEETGKSVIGTLSGIDAADQKVKEIDPDLAVINAKALFRAKYADGVDMESGPCLAEEIFTGWCVDVAHNPRKESDDLPENQCQSYLEGRVKHLVELDTQGNLIRVE